jgi:hypothetical protein
MKTWQQEMILSTAFIGGMTALYCGLYLIIYGELPRW